MVNFSLWGVLHVVVFNTILFLALMAHTRAMLSDPGIVPLTAQGDQGENGVPRRSQQRPLQQHLQDHSSDSDSESPVRSSFVVSSSVPCLFVSQITLKTYL